MARRLYLGRLPTDARQEEVQKMFDGYGSIVDCRVMAGKGFGFVEFESSRDAEDAVQAFNGKSFMGSTIVVEFAKEARRRDTRDDDRGYGRPPPRSRRPPGFRIIVQGVSRDTSWQDLKDFGREAGSVSFADIDRDHPGEGILEYHTRDDAEAAVKALDSKELRGNVVKVALDGERDYRRDSRPSRDSRYSRSDGYSRDDRYRDDRGHRYDSGYSRSDDRYDDRYRDPPRSERSRSPRRSDYDRRRSPPKRDYDDKKMDLDDRRYDDRSRHDNGRYDDRRGRDDDRAPPKRRDDDRYDDRKPADGGDGGWSRT